MSWAPCLVELESGQIRLGHPLVDRYLEFVAARGRRNTLLAAAYDLKVFFSVVGKDPVDVTTADVLDFITVQRGDRRVVRISDGESDGLSARTAGASGPAERPGVLGPRVLAQIALVALLAVACTQLSTTAGDGSTTSTQASSTDSVGSSSSTRGDLQVDGYNFDSEDVFVRSCESQLFGGERLGPTADTDDVVGPLVMSGLSTVDEFEPEDLVPDSNGELKILKFPTELAGLHTVWLGISPKDRTEAWLIYDSSRWSTDTGRLPLTAGDAVVAFEYCHDNGGYTQYNGGILVNGPICITMEVWEGDVFLEPLTKRVAFGSGTQC